MAEDLRLPDFIAVGPPRTGTSWLHRAIAENVGRPRGLKETKYFTENYDKGLDWYAAFFRDYPPRLRIAEICPQYFAFDEARERIKHHIPNCRIMCTLRDPVERLYSHWRLVRRDGWVDFPFEKSLTEPVLNEHAQYARNVMKWRNVFGSENVLVTIYDDLERNPQAYLDQIADFAGFPRVQYSELPVKLREQRINTVTRFSANARRAAAIAQLQERLKRAHVYKLVQFWGRRWFWDWIAGASNEFPPLDPLVAARMREQMLPEIEAVEKLVDRDLSNWKNPAN